MAQEISRRIVEGRADDSFHDRKSIIANAFDEEERENLLGMHS
jgi:hypothetical protein